jgi:hypothetical protein
MPVLKVLLDENGKVVGTAQASAAGSGPNGPEQASPVARPGQRLVEITVDDKTAALDPVRLHNAIQEMNLK